jgi:peptide/nickel transport system permease protein
MLKKHPLLWYYLKKIGAYLFTIWGAFTVTFFLFRLLPTDPIRTWMKSLEGRYAVRMQGGTDMVAQFKEQFGLNGNLWQQYTHYLSNLVLRGDMGPSFVNFPNTVQSLIAQRLPWTLVLLGTSIVISWLLGLIVGLLAAWFRDRRWSGTVTNVSVALSQVPPYIIAVFLVLLFGYQLRWLPYRGSWDAQYPLGFNWPFIKSAIRYAILPSASLVIVSVSGWILSTRSLVISVLGEDYLTYAEAKGLRTWDIMRRYALRNVMLPQATALALTLGAVMNGTLLIETFFIYPGIGDLMYQAVRLMDFNTIMGIVLLSIVSVMTASLVMDIIIPVLDPRIRTGIQAA